MSRAYVGRWTAIGAISLASLAGCASIGPVATVQDVSEELGNFTASRLVAPAANAEEIAARQERVAELLAHDLSQDDAVEIALLNSPATEALIAGRLAAMHDAAQGGRIPNPVFSFERVRVGDELELGRLLSFGLLDLLTLPQRARTANYRIDAARIGFAGAIVDHVTAVKASWVKAVAAGERVGFARRIHDNTEAAAELARRMEAAGNFNRITRARHQAQYADSATQLVLATQQATTSREELVRALGLDATQTAQLRLPARLPAVPAAPLEPDAVAQRATRERLDVRLANAELAAAASMAGLTKITSLTDVEFGFRRDTVFDKADGDRSTARGWEVEVRLPLFDLGDTQRGAAAALAQAAAARREAAVRNAVSHLRESYTAYRSAHDIATHYREEILPLQQLIAEENVLRYNGMLIGVFELLAETNAQARAVSAAISANELFWLAAARLAASAIGRPSSASPVAIETQSTASAGAGH